MIIFFLINVISRVFIYIFIVNKKLRSVVGLQDLKDYMRQAGEVTYADAHKQHRNEGYVFIYVQLCT